MEIKQLQVIINIMGGKAPVKGIRARFGDVPRGSCAADWKAAGLTFTLRRVKATPVFSEDSPTVVCSPSPSGNEFWVSLSCLELI